MPNKDGKGPNGQGPKTGRGLGNCTTDENSENLRGRGQGDRCPCRGCGPRNN